MPMVDERHDTDPSPAPRGGNGHDKSGFPCAVHEAQLAENRDVIREVRDAVRVIAQRQGDEIEARAKRDGEIEEAIVDLVAEVKGLRNVIGTAPDLSTGTVGTGMRGQIAAAVNASIKGAARREMPSLVDAEESEVTGIMDRDALVARARIAEAHAAKIRIAAYAAGAVAVIVAIGGAVVAVLQAWPD